jgi:hypothetical protein
MMFKVTGKTRLLGPAAGAALLFTLTAGAWAKPLPEPVIHPVPIPKPIHKPPPPPPPPPPKHHKDPAPEINLTLLGIEGLLAGAGITALVLDRRRRLVSQS